MRCLFSGCANKIPFQRVLSTLQSSDFFLSLCFAIFALPCLGGALFCREFGAANDANS